MRTSIILDDELGKRLRRQAWREGKSFSAFLADAGRRALESEPAGRNEPFRLITFRGTGPRVGVDLDRANKLIAAEDARLYGERGEPTE